MKRITFFTALCCLLAAQPALALTEVVTYIPAYWVERDGSYTVYGLNNGPCGSSIFGVSKALSNFNEMRIALLLAATKNYKVDLVVEGCEGTKNTVTFMKVCRDTAYC